MISRLWTLPITALLLASTLAACTHRGDAPVGPAPPAPVPTPTAPSSRERSDGAFFVADPSQRVVAIRRADAPNVFYARLGREVCEDELARRGVAFVRGELMEGVLAPVRLRGPVRGVSIHTALSRKEQERSLAEVFDCRLVLALDDFAAVVARRGIVEIIHLGAYRSKAQHGCTARYWGLQHCAALAVDVRAFKRSDGSVLEVERDFHGRIGLGTCAEGVAPSPATPAATELWTFACEAATLALFHVILTPNYNADHRNHFHLEITPEAGWMMVK